MKSIVADDHAKAARVRLGASTTGSAEALERLASDPSATVRATLALNPAAPANVNAMLAKDADERIRVLLARKLASLVPGLTGEIRTSLRQQAYETLTTLVADEAARVRAAIAAELKALPNAPRALILRLAQDAAIMVAEPVILFSPLLTTQDLVALVTNAPSEATALAVARRPDVDEVVCDVIAETASNKVIHALLSNPSAHIREATLDALIARATAQTDWQDPLVRRPSLPPRSARALSEIVTGHLLEVLAARVDLDPRLAEELRGRIAARLSPEPPKPASTPRDEAVPAVVENGAISPNHLTEESVLEAVRHGETRMAAALLAVASGLPMTVVERATALRSAKGVVSITWKAGFCMRTAVALQALLTRLAPADIVKPAADGGYPLSKEEMRWQLDFLTHARR